MSTHCGKCFGQGHSEALCDSIGKPLKETVTIERAVTGPIADLVHFAKYLAKNGYNLRETSDGTLIQLARSYWDMAHGED